MNRSSSSYFCRRPGGPRFSPPKIKKTQSAPRPSARGRGHRDPDRTPPREVASAVTVIGRTEIERSTRSNVLDLIQDGLGLAVSVRNGGPGAASSLFLRGANSEHILVLLDGVEFNDPMNPSRSFDLAHMTLDGVEQIEVLRGPQSTLYGSDALAGVVNILTRRGSGKPRLSLETGGGAYGTARGAAAVSGGAGPVSYAFGLSEFVTRGFSAASDRFPGNAEKDGYRNFSASGNLVFTLSRDAEAGLTVRATSARTDLDSFGGPGGDDPNSVQKYDSVFLRGHARALLARGRWEMTGGLSYVHADRTNDNPDRYAPPFRFRTGPLPQRTPEARLAEQYLSSGRPYPDLRRRPGARTGRFDLPFRQPLGPLRQPFPGAVGGPDRGLCPGPDPPRRPVLRRGGRTLRPPQPDRLGLHLAVRPGHRLRRDGDEIQGHDRDGFQVPLALPALRAGHVLGAGGQRSSCARNKASAGTPESSRFSGAASSGRACPISATISAT